MPIIEEKLNNLGIELPIAPVPVAAYVPACSCLDGRLVFVSGQDCRKKGVLLYEGKLGRDVNIEQGKECAKQAMLNCLAALKSCIGDLDKVLKIVKVTGYINSADNFQEQPYVLNGASELLIELYGDAGKHARAAIGMKELPFGTPVEIEMVVEIKN